MSALGLHKKVLLYIFVVVLVYLTNIYYKWLQSGVQAFNESYISFKLLVALYCLTVN